MYPNVFPNNLATMHNFVILPNISTKRIDIYPKISKYQVAIHDKKNLCLILSSKNCNHWKCHLTSGKKENSNIILCLCLKVH